MTKLKAPKLPLLSEASFQKQVLRLASLYGWLSYHTYDSRRCQKGFPDLVLAKGDRLLFVELKSQKGKVKPEQGLWLHTLRQAGVPALVWRPADWKTIQEELSR